jgi:hypothetical protein
VNRRKLIRDYIVDLLDRSLEDTQVYHSRRIPIASGECRVVNVSIEKEHSEPFAKSPLELKKTAELSIEILALDFEDENSDDLIDSITAKIEELLHFDESFHNLIDQCVLKSTETYYVRESEQEQGMARMVYEVIYFSIPHQTSRLDDFTQAFVQFKERNV